VRRENRAGEQGFTLIEVLVASAIIMASIGILMQLFASGLDRTRRAGQLAHLLSAQRTIAHQLEMVNPATQKRGKGVAEGIHYHWQADMLAPFAPIYDPEDLSRRQLGLFLLRVTMQYGSNKQSEFDMKRLGWKTAP